MSVVFPARALRIPSLRDIVLLLLAAAFLLQNGLPHLHALAQDSGSASRAALSSSFTYQGTLVKDGVPVDGATDFQFALYAADTGGSPTNTMPDLLGADVSDGFFSVQLDFGSVAFTGADRFLEIRTRPAGVGAYTTLPGRVRLTATPYALYARATDWSGIANKPAGLDDGDDGQAYTAGAGISLTGNVFGLSVTGCVAGEVWKYNGNTWTCEPDAVGAGGGGGDITSVMGGAGLFGGANSGDAVLAVAFGGDGSQDFVARSDHNHLNETWTGFAQYGLTIDVGGTAILAKGATGAIEGTTTQQNGAAIEGRNTGPCTSNLSCIGVRGIGVTTSGGVGVAGDGNRYGVRGTSTQITGVGVYGTNTSACNDFDHECYGILGVTNGLFGTAIKGDGGTGTGVEGTGDIGVWASGEVTGVRAFGKDAFASGVWATGVGTGTTGAAIRANSNADVVGTTCGTSHQQAFCYGIFSEANVSNQAGIGVYGYGTNTGVYGSGLIGIHGSGTTAGLFDGQVTINGGMTASGTVRVNHILPALSGGPHVVGDSTTRWTEIFATNGTINTSDVRLKKDIVAVPYGLDAILDLQPVRFAWIDSDANGDGTHLGLIAQDVDEVIPDVVRKDENDADAPWGVSYTELIPVLINAIQEQQEQIDSLRNGDSVAASPADAPAPVSASANVTTTDASPLAFANIVAALALLVAVVGAATAMRRSRA